MHAKLHAKMLVDSALHDKFGARFRPEAAQYRSNGLAGTLLATGCLPAARVLLLASRCFCRPGWLSGGLGGRLADCCGQVADDGWRDGWVAVPL